MSDKGYKKDEVLRFIECCAEEKSKSRHRHTLYYEKVYDEHGLDGGTFIKWNTPAFFFGPYWMFYRGMFLSAFIYLICLFGVFYLGEAFDEVGLSLGEAIFYWVTWHLYFGFFGNSLYMRFIRKRLDWGQRREGIHPRLLLIFIFLVTPLVATLTGNVAFHTVKALTHASHHEDYRGGFYRPLHVIHMDELKHEAKDVKDKVHHLFHHEQ